MTTKNCFTTLPEEVCSQMLTTVKETEDACFVSQSKIDDCQEPHMPENPYPLSLVKSIDCQKSPVWSSIPLRGIIDNAKQNIRTISNSSMQSSSIIDRDCGNLLANQVDQEPFSTQSFIMRRFLPAAQEIAAMEQESFKRFLASRSATTGKYPSATKPQRPPVGHRIKRRAQQASKGFIATSVVHAKQKDEDVCLSMKSCGFICPGLKNAIFQVRCSVSASKWRNLVFDLAGDVKASEKGNIKKMSKKQEETDAMKSLIWTKDASAPHCAGSEICGNTRGLAMTCLANCSQTRVSRVECSPLSRRGGISNFASTRGSLSSSKFKEENVTEGLATDGIMCLSCHLHAQKTHMHDLVNTDIMESSLHMTNCGSKIKSCSQQDLTEKDGDMLSNDYLELDLAWHDADSNDDIDSLYFDALSRINSVKSSVSACNTESPRSVCEKLGSKSEQGMKTNSISAKVLTDFGFPQGSNNKDVTNNHSERQIRSNGEPSNLSQRFGKALKVEIFGHTNGMSAYNSCNCKSPQFEDGRMLQRDDRRVETFIKLEHCCLNHKYPMQPETVLPIFPAKCKGVSALGWPFGISTYQSSKLETSPEDSYPSKHMKINVPGFEVPLPPLPPPPPKNSWLSKAILKNMSSVSRLRTLQQKHSAQCFTTAHSAAET